MCVGCVSLFCVERVSIQYSRISSTHVGFYHLSFFSSFFPSFFLLRLPPPRSVWDKWGGKLKELKLDGGTSGSRLDVTATVADLEKLTQLTQLKIFNMGKLTGALGASFGTAMGNLVNLWLKSNAGLAGVLPAEMGEMVKLTFLEIQSCAALSGALCLHVFINWF